MSFIVKNIFTFHFCRAKFKGNYKQPDNIRNEWKAGMTGKLEWPESWNDRNAGMTGEKE
jgi:hypothetical protein